MEFITIMALGKVLQKRGKASLIALYNPDHKRAVAFWTGTKLVSEGKGMLSFNCGKDWSFQITNSNGIHTGAELDAEALYEGFHRQAAVDSFIETHTHSLFDELSQKKTA